MNSNHRPDYILGQAAYVEYMYDNYITNGISNIPWHHIFCEYVKWKLK